MAGALLTDLYELNMAASYLRREMTGAATFSLFVRRLPVERGFLVAAGIEDCLDALETLCFDESELAYLATLDFDEAAIERFANLRFTGEVRAVPEGRIVFADEPLLEVTAPIAEAQLVETILLNQVTFQTTLASKAARCRLAGCGRVELVEFGFRRTQGVEAGMAVARGSAMVGFSATSNVEAARRYGLRPAGTMAHSYIEAFATELEAFEAFARDFPGKTTFLVDTYDTLEGVARAIGVIEKLGLRHDVGVRLDSGDLVALARSTRRLLDDAGTPTCASSSRAASTSTTSPPLWTKAYRLTPSGWGPASGCRQTPRTSTASTSWCRTTGGRLRSSRPARRRTRGPSRSFVPMAWSTSWDWRRSRHHRMPTPCSRSS